MSMLIGIGIGITLSIIAIWLGKALKWLTAKGIIFNPVDKRYELTRDMKRHIRAMGSEWTTYQMTQDECINAGFLSGNRGNDGYYCYNSTVWRCGNVIKFRNNTIYDSSTNTRYAWLK